MAKELDSIGIPGLSKLDASVQTRIFSGLKRIKTLARFSEALNLLNALQAENTHQADGAKLLHYMDVLEIMHVLESNKERDIDSFRWRVVPVLQKIETLKEISNETKTEQENILERLKNAQSVHALSDTVHHLKKKCLEQPNNHITEVLDTWFEEKDTPAIRNFVENLRYITHKAQNIPREGLKDRESLLDSLELEKILLSSCIKQEKNFKACSEKVSKRLCSDLRGKGSNLNDSQCTQSVQLFANNLENNFKGSLEESNMRSRIKKIEGALELAEKNKKNDTQEIQEIMKKEREQVEKKIALNLNNVYKEIAQEATLPEGVQVALDQVASKYPKPVIHKRTFV